MGNEDALLESPTMRFVRTVRLREIRFNQYSPGLWIGF
jgi:hypothetical protein